MVFSPVQGSIEDEMNDVGGLYYVSCPGGRGLFGLPGNGLDTYLMA